MNIKTKLEAMIMERERDMARYEHMDPNVDDNSYKRFCYEVPVLREVLEGLEKE